jgi:hypothetical protein
VNRTVTPRRRKNADLRTREYLAPDKIETLLDALKHTGLMISHFSPVARCRDAYLCLLLDPRR